MAVQGPMLWLSVHPCRGLVDEKIKVLVQHAAPVQRLTVHTLLRSEDGDDWEAFGHYVSDSAGAVDVSEDVCLGGTYSGHEPMGLLWSLRPVPGSRPSLRFRKKDTGTPMLVTISLHQGFLSDSFTERLPLASRVVERWYMAPGVHRVELTEGGVTGTLFLPPGPGQFPAVLDLPGGGRSLPEARAVLLASHGFVTLALNYLNPRRTAGGEYHVGNDYFQTAFSVLQTHPQVIRERIAIVGLSFGASMALGLSVYSPTIKPSCLVSISGSHVQPAGGSLGDIFAEFKKNEKNTRYDEEKRVIWHDLLLPIPSNPSKKVDVGQLCCPLLLIVGKDDQNWPAEESASDMKEMMEMSGNGHLLTVLSYPDTGHLIEPPYSPHCRSSNFINAESREKFVVLWGGEVTAHCHAQEDSWWKILDFLKKHLYYGPQSDITSCT
ncbi:acyl-CoA thioesterase 19 [Gadus chalcogrammus]|uniref:acyl-CoA thioesterase 19 n=1 Tax=Gadus chalcogrammus TaxID=1042646 RepID=UPI0024C49E07|nr:acyl-CoA thioesterase 19 [Gadus chalcogrammus]